MAVPSSLPVTSRVPSRVTATDQTGPEWASNVGNTCPPSRSQLRTLPSSLPASTRRPSGVTATDQTGLWA